MSSREQPAQSLTDRDLVVAYQAGDPAAYEEMYRRYSHRVERICLRMLGNPQDADEATQEAFLKAFQALPRFNGNYQLGAWLARIASNVCLDQLRARSRSGHLVALPEADDLAEPGGPEDLVTGDGARLKESLHHLQPLHARALMLRTFEGLSHQEMAGKLAMSPAQVKALLHRARTSFRRAWQRAEGWALAPVLGFRSFVAGRSRTPTDMGGPVSGLTGATPMMNPLLAERVAASAVIVAAALTGFPSTPTSEPVRPRPIAAAPSTTVAAANRVADQPRVAPAPSRQAARPAAADEDDGINQALMRKLHAAVHDHERNAKKARKKANGPDDPGVPVGPAGTKPVTRKIKKVLDQIPPPR